MNEKKISANPRAASKAPLSPRGKAAKKTTATSADNRAEIEKTVSDILGGILDKKLAGLREDLIFRADYSLLETDELLNESKTAFRADEAIPAIYEKEGGFRLVLQPGEENRILGGTCRGTKDFKDYCGGIAKRAEDCAELISRRETELGNVIEFLDTKENGFFRREIVDQLLHFPRIVLYGEEVRIGGLQLYADPQPGDQSEEDALDAKARAPFDALVHHARQYIALAAKRYTTASAALLAIIPHLDDMAEALGNCRGGRSMSIVSAAQNAVNAARLARITLESDPFCIFANEVKWRTSEKRGKDRQTQETAIHELIDSGFAGAFEPGTKAATAKRLLINRCLLGTPRKTKPKAQKRK